MCPIRYIQARGACACGGVVFEVDGPMRPVIGCHCETCRRISGHYWAASAVYAADLRITESRGLKWFRSSAFAERGFCGDCGSSLFYRVDAADRVSVAAGALDRPTGLTLAEHIGMAEASDYHRVDPALPQRSDCTVSPRFRLPVR